jgi:hypothetical protein
MDKEKASSLLIFFFCLFGIYLSSHYSYLLFHSAAELFSIIVGFIIFIITWNSRRQISNNIILFLGLSYFL